MSERRNERKRAKEVPKEEQNYTIIVDGIRKVINYEEYQDYLKETAPQSMEPVPAEVVGD